MEDINYSSPIEEADSNTYNDVNKTVVLFSKTPTKCKCSKCGKEFDEWDERNDFLINHIPSYGSIYDGERIQIRLCCECMDDFFKSILKDFQSGASIPSLDLVKLTEAISNWEKIIEQPNVLSGLEAYKDNEDVARIMRAWRTGTMRIQDGDENIE